jgi:hypothetical protein
MKAALRAIGIALGMLGLVIIVLYLFGIALGSETPSLVAGGGRGAWIGNMTSDDIEVRARLMGAVGVLVGALTAIAGVALLLLKRWALWFTLIPICLALLFPPLSRLILPARLGFQGPDIGDYAVAAAIALVSSAALMFRKGFKNA